MKEKSLHKATTVALAISLPALAFAAEDVTLLPTLEVQAADQTSLNKKTSSTKRSETLLDTAKTTQVLNTKQLEERNVLSLKQALATTPGVTFGAGETGHAANDAIRIRGYDADYNVTIDGLRDAAIQKRSDLFNYEAVEITKGANAAESGVGQISGNINLVTKKPLDNRDLNNFHIGVGTDDYRRATIDINRVINDRIAVRLNVMGHKDTYAGRIEERKRWGIAPSLSYKAGDNTKVIFSYYYQKDDNTPTFGVPFINVRPVPGISDANYYSYKNLDKQDGHTSIATIAIESQLSNNVALNAITRYSDIQYDNVYSTPRGDFCLSNGTKPTAFTNSNLTGYTTCSKPGIYTPITGTSPIRRGLTFKENTKQISQDINLHAKLNTGSIEHNIITGIGFSYEDYSAQTGNLGIQATTDDGTTDTNVYNPSTTWTGSINPRTVNKRDANLSILSFYITDTIKFTPQWLLNVGGRFDYTKGDYTNLAVATNTKTTSEAKTNLYSYNVGLVYKPTENSSIYANFANAQKPVRANANASCTITGNNANCSTDPEEGRNYEIGAKWQITPALGVVGAIFRNEQNKVRINAETATQPQILDGKNHIDGVEIGVNGLIVPKWSFSLSAAYMKGEIDKGAAGSTDVTKGSKLLNVPKFSGSLWTSYNITDKLKVSYGLTYQGKFYVNAPSSTFSQQLQTDDYLVHNASISYDFNKNFGIQLFVDNLTNEKYYTDVRNNIASSFAMPGEERRTVLNLNYKF